jgi:hypothetical protein
MSPLNHNNKAKYGPALYVRTKAGKNKLYVVFYIFFKGEYMTIHITPEPEFSYVSFESNIPLTSYLGVIQRVLATFLPGKFILTIFANRVIEFIFYNCIGPKK